MEFQLVSPQASVDFQENKRLLNRYRFIEHQMLTILAAWLPATPHMETKLEMGRLLWEDAQHVQSLYGRLREVQNPTFRRPDDEALELLMHEAINAPTPADMLAGLFRVLKPALVGAYRHHLDATFANPDAPTLYYLRHILLDEEAQLAWAREALANHPVGEWEGYLTALLARAGGITGNDARCAAPSRPSCYTPFESPREALRDERFSTDMSRKTRWDENDVAQRRLNEFTNYAQEIVAAETVALLLYTTADSYAESEMPWEFTLDLARHCYDETRHCKLGIEWLEQHGFDYTAFPQNTQIYAWRSQFDPLTQYTLLTMGNESHAFTYRHGRHREYQQLGDRLSEQYLNYDMADERQHVAFGHKWLPALMRSQGETRPLKEYIADVVELWEREYVSGTMPLHETTSKA